MASEKSIDLKKCLTPEFRVSFPAVFEPKAFENQEPKYSVVMLFDKSTDLKTPAAGKLSLRRAAFNAAVEMWGPKEKWPKRLRFPFRDGEERSDTDGYADCIFVTATSKTQPGLVGPDLKAIINQKDFYAGCYARAEVIAFAYETAGNRGVSFSLQNIQKLRDGTPFSGRKNAEDVFDAVEDGSDDEDNYEDDDAEEDDAPPAKKKKRASDGMGF